MKRVRLGLVGLAVVSLLVTGAHAAHAGGGKKLDALQELTARDFRKGAKPLPPQIADEQIMMAKAQVYEAGPSSPEYPDYLFHVVELLLDKKAYLDAEVVAVDAELPTANPVRAQTLNNRRAALVKAAAATGDAAVAKLSALLEAFPKGAHVGPATLSFADFYYGKAQYKKAKALYVQAAAATQCSLHAYALYMIGLCDLQANKPAAAHTKFKETMTSTCTGMKEDPATQKLWSLAKQAAKLAKKS